MIWNRPSGNFMAQKRSASLVGSLRNGLIATSPAAYFGLPNDRSIITGSVVPI